VILEGVGYISRVASTWNGDSHMSGLLLDQEECQCPLGQRADMKQNNLYVICSHLFLLTVSGWLQSLHPWEPKITFKEPEK
jgi:hypothetical protein